MRFIFPTILVIVSLVTFFMYTNPTYQNDIKGNLATQSMYSQALNSAQKLQEERDALSLKYRNFDPDVIARLSKLLPDNVDNIRLVIDIQNMAKSYGMSISNTKFDANPIKNATGQTAQLSALSPADVASSNSPYGTFNIEFTTVGNYDNFLSFLKDVESSLRLTDVVSVDFSSDMTDATKPYTYTVKLQTYWLKG